MASKTQIANLALLRIGVSQQLTDVDTDTSREALSARLIFDDERDFVLRDFPWPWARKYKTLALVTGSVASPANSDWIYAYRYPADCVFVRRVVTSLGRHETNPPPFALGRDGAGISKSITGATAANPVVITSTAHGFVNGDEVFIVGVVGMTQINNRLFTVASATANTFALTGENGTTHTAYSSGGTVSRSGRLIFSDEASAQVEYTLRVIDAIEFDSVFVSMLAWRVAAQLALSLSRMPELSKAALESYAAERASAISRGVAEGQHAIATGSTSARIREIFHLALTRIGVLKNAAGIASEITFEALWPRVNFADERDYVLRDFPWPWATKYRTLTKIAGTAVTVPATVPANDDWDFVYRYPTDCLFARRIVTTSGRQETDPPRFRIGRDFAAQNTAATTVTLTTGAGWTTTDTITVTASVAATFVAADVGRYVEVESGSDRVRILIVTFTSGTVVSGTPDITVPTSLRSTALTTWSKVFYDGRVIYTQQDDAVLEYSLQVTDPAEFDSFFVSMLAWKIAATLSPALAKDPKTAPAMMQMYLVEKSAAQSRALNEGQLEAPLEAEWTRAREGPTAGRGGVWEAFPGGFTVD